MMKACILESYSTKTVTIIYIYINTTFSSIVFIAYQISASKSSHCHCFWNLSHNHNILYNIVSFQSSPDIQNCIYQFCTHSVVQFWFYVYLAEYSFHFYTRVWYWLHNMHWTVFLMGFLQWHLHTSILQFNMLLCQ